MSSSSSSSSSSSKSSLSSFSSSSSSKSSLSSFSSNSSSGSSLGVSTSSSSSSFIRNYDAIRYNQVCDVYKDKAAQLSSFDPTTQTILANRYRFGGSGFVVTAPPNNILPTVTTNFVYNNYSLQVDVNSTVVAAGSTPVTVRGVVWSDSTGPTTSNHNVTSGSGLGVYVTNLTELDYTAIHARAYAINSVGTAYGNELVFNSNICLARGTLITLADGSVKRVENIEYTDDLLVWDFDTGWFTHARPLWIKMSQSADEYHLLTFSDGSKLCVVGQHRIFNKRTGSFTYPMNTPLDTVTFNAHAEEVTLVDKETVRAQTESYNVITDRHLNLFANGILTSCRHNNLYPIKNMRFVKDDRYARAIGEYAGVSDRFYTGLRLAEQTAPIDGIVEYVKRLESLEVRTQSEVGT